MRGNYTHITRKWYKAAYLFVYNGNNFFPCLFCKQTDMQSRLQILFAIFESDVNVHLLNLELLNPLILEFCVHTNVYFFFGYLCMCVCVWMNYSREIETPFTAVAN